MKKISIAFIALLIMPTIGVAQDETRAQFGKFNAEIFELSPSVFLVKETPTEQVRSIESIPNMIDSVRGEGEERADTPIKFFIIKNFNQKQQIAAVPSGNKILSEAHVYKFSDHTAVIINWYDAENQRLGWYLNAYDSSGNSMKTPIILEFPRGAIEQTQTHGNNTVFSPFDEGYTDKGSHGLILIKLDYKNQFTGDTYDFAYQHGVLEKMPLSAKQMEEKESQRTGYCSEMFDQFKEFASSNVSNDGKIAAFDTSERNVAYFHDHLRYQNLIPTYKQDLVAFHDNRNVRYADFDKKYCNISALRNSLEPVTQPDGSIKPQIVLRDGIASNVQYLIGSND